MGWAYIKKITNLNITIVVKVGRADKIFIKFIKSIILNRKTKCTSYKKQLAFNCWRINRKKITREKLLEGIYSNKWNIKVCNI